MSEARVVAPRAPWSLRMLVHEMVAAAQKSFHMVGRLRPSSSCGTCSPALGKPLGRHQTFRQVASSEESIEFIAIDERAMRQRVCIVLELAPYRRRLCLMFGGRGVFSTALSMVDMTSSVHLRWALGQRDVVSAVPR